MKTLLSFMLSCCLWQAGAQGRVVINEYMPWTGNACQPTSEFIELLNFGPGPVNIGCYVLTEGDYAITIPPNTILQPGQFYVLAGQSTLAAGCANIDSATRVQLNWNNCSQCTSAPIPTTGDGLFTDGGSASEQLVLLDPDLRVVDAVVRDISLREPSATLTIGGPCGTRSFNLDQMNIRYEMIGESAGRANSFAREVDGDCRWVKDSRQSAGATNNTAGETNALNYDLTYVRSRDCDPLLRGSVYISVSGAAAATAFPLTYTLVQDVDSNGVFNQFDHYTTGIDSTPPYLELDRLAQGSYRISVGSALGCNLRTIDFYLLPCTATLPLQILSFRHLPGNGVHQFMALLADARLLQTAWLEGSMDGVAFTTISNFQPREPLYDSQPLVLQAPGPAQAFYRLRLRTLDGQQLFSPHLSLHTAVWFDTPRLWPNPASSQVQVSIPAKSATVVNYRVVNSTGQEVLRGRLQPGTAVIDVQQLPKGVYHVELADVKAKQPIPLRFVKR